MCKAGKCGPLCCLDDQQATRNLGPDCAPPMKLPTVGIEVDVGLALHDLEDAPPRRLALGKVLEVGGRLPQGKAADEGREEDIDDIAACREGREGRWWRVGSVMGHPGSSSGSSDKCRPVMRPAQPAKCVSCALPPPCPCPAACFPPVYAPASTLVLPYHRVSA